MSLSLPTLLFHYYEAARGPFCSLSDLDPEAAEAVLTDIRTRGVTFASQRKADYLSVRRELEFLIRQKFIEKGGRPRLAHPYTMTLGACPWLLTWYQDGRDLCIPLADFPPDVIGFTYGDTFPAMRFQDGKLYRGQVYTLAELPELVRQFGLPQDWNPDGKGGPERYIEAQIWDETPIVQIKSQISGDRYENGNM
jgi:hypothetical protein